MEKDIYKLITQWGVAVKSILDDERYMKDEYLNGLDCRYLIAQNEGNIPDNLKRELVEYDKEFIEKTIEIPVCVWGIRNEIKYQYNSKTEWYYYRLPLTRKDWLNCPPGNE
jgi:hypothetical protein